MLMKMWSKGNTSVLLVSMWICENTMESSMESPQKIKNRNALWSSTFNSGYLPEEKKKPIQKDIYTPMFIAALFTMGKIWKQPKCPLIDEWIKKRWYICMYVCVYIYIYLYVYIHTIKCNSAIKKEKSFCD